MKFNTVLKSFSGELSSQYIQDTQGFRYSAEDFQIHQPLFSDSETHKQCFVCDKFPSSDLSQVVFVLQTAVELGYPLERTDLWVDPMWTR
jgi:hypothetical protein